MLRSKNLIIIISLFFLVWPSKDLCAKKISRRRSFSARAAILVDVKKNKILFSRNMHSRLEPASTAKIMTALLVLEKLDLETEVSASAEASSQAPSKIYLRPGATYKVKDLLHALLMVSANDAAVCLAEAVSGSEADFAKLMNNRGRQLSCKNTHFVNASGLPARQESQYSSAYDLSLMIRKLVKYPLALEVMKKKYYSFEDSAGRAYRFSNHDKLLWRFPGVAVGKTGYTKKAGHCFVGNDILDGKEIVFAVLKSKTLWSDVQYLLRRAGCIK